MASPLQFPIQMLFRMTSKQKALQQASDYLGMYQTFLAQAGGKAGQSRNVPKMLGVDEDMRDWSLYQLLEHNTIVNNAITQLICDLAAGVDPSEMNRIDPKNDVMPSADAGPEQVEIFKASVEDHIARVTPLSDLRKTIKVPHPLFGMFNAHMWTCMFSFHLKVHLKQAELLAKGDS